MIEVENLKLKHLTSFILISVLMTILIFAGCSRKGNLGENLDDLKEKNIAEGETLAKQSQSNSPKIGRTVFMETTKGTVRFELYEEDAPVTTKNFIDLIESGFYNGLTFHRLEPGFVVQGGDPKGDGTGGSSKTIPLEISPKLRHVKGALGMARSAEKDSASSQFYFTLEASHFLDDNYAVFGIVTEGMDVVQKLQVGDKMTKVTIQG
ncbi:MAG: peptidylprolyl isomerase [Nanoarchaeota archaeon]|nr:peptidylprolyl isomerase [Nanoarchaeota archaeon]